MAGAPAWTDAFWKVLAHSPENTQRARTSRCRPGGAAQMVRPRWRRPSRADGCSFRGVRRKGRMCAGDA